MLRRFTREIHSDVVSKGCCHDVFKIISSLYSASKLKIVLVQISVFNFAETTLSKENQRYQSVLNSICQLIACSSKQVSSLGFRFAKIIKIYRIEIKGITLNSISQLNEAFFEPVYLIFLPSKTISSSFLPLAPKKEGNKKIQQKIRKNLLIPKIQFNLKNRNILDHIQLAGKIS